MTPTTLLKNYGVSKLSDLAKILCSNTKSLYYGKSEKSIRSFLSQIFNGSRKLPDELKESIIGCLIELNADINSLSLSEEIDEVFHLMELRRKDIYNQKLNDVRIAQKNDYDLLIRCIKDAVSVSVITAEPAEVKNNILADRLKHELLKKVGIIESNEKRAEYKFYLSQGPFDNTPFDFWEGLYKYAFSLQIPDIEEKFKTANKDILKIFSVPDYEVDVMHGIIDENLPQQISFITVYNKVKMSNVEEVSVIREENENLSRILRRLHRFRELYAKREYTFEQALKIINR